MALKRRDASQLAAGGGGEATPGSFGVKHPRLWEMLTETKYEDGSPRKTATITFFIDEGCVKVCLNDRDQSLAAFCSGDTLDAALRALEAGLEAESLEWRRSQMSSKKKGK